MEGSQSEDNRNKPWVGPGNRQIIVFISAVKIPVNLWIICGASPPQCLCKVNVYTDNEMISWSTSWLLLENGSYIALQSSSAWWNKPLNFSLLHVLTVFTHTHVWRHCADTLLSPLSMRSTTHVAHTLTGPHWCRTVNIVAFEPWPPVLRAFISFSRGWCGLIQKQVDSFPFGGMTLDATVQMKEFDVGLIVF